MNEGTNIVPDGTEPIVAWRAWNVFYPYHLTNINNHDIWMPRERMEARCINSNHPEDAEIPSIKCTCGVYALREQRQVNQQFSNAAAYGEVYLWGRIVEFDRGFKAQYAYPKSLFLTHKKLEEILPLIESAYGVPTKIVPVPIVENQQTTWTPKQTISKEDFIAIAFSDDAPLDVRRLARNQARMRATQRVKALEKRIQALARTWNSCKNELKQEQTMVAALDLLKQKLHQ